MTPFASRARAAGVALLLLSALPAQTFIVDVNNGPGTSFTQIQPAIDAASPGDVILVRSGFYRSFVLSKGLSLVADRFVAPEIVVVDPGCVIRNVPAGQSAWLKNLFLGNLAIHDCAGLVAADALALTPPSLPLGPEDTWVLDVRTCADARMRQLGLNPGSGSGRVGVRVRDARLEIDGASIDGARGPTGAPGGTGLSCEAGSVVHVSFSQVRGGEVGPGGPVAGSAIHARSGATVAVDGIIENRIIGGFGGSCGVPGAAFTVDAGATVRVSHEVRVEGGTSPCVPSGGPLFEGPGTVTVANPADLAIVFDGGIPSVGVPARLVVAGVPGALAVLLAGSAPALQPLPPFQANPLLLQPVLSAPLGAIPKTGHLFREIALPASAPPGVGVLVQVATVRPSGDFFLSNSTVLVTR